MKALSVLKWTALVVFVALLTMTAFARGAQAQETGAGYTPHILYCDWEADAEKFVRHLMVEENDMARNMLAAQASSCHDTRKEMRPPMYARNAEVLFSAPALGHTFTVERAETPSGRVIYVMGAYKDK